MLLLLQNEGRSLHSMMYEPLSSSSSEQDAAADDSAAAGSGESAGGGSGGSGLSVVGPSRWWRAVRRSPDGHAFVAHMMRQLLMGLAALQAAGISHRDIKPENMLVTEHTPHTQQAGGAAASPPPLSLHLRLIDFGSALDEGCLAAGLYGRQPASGRDSGGADASAGPGLAELTLEYAPPEVLFASR